MCLNPKQLLCKTWLFGALFTIFLAGSCSEPMAPQLSKDMKKRLDSIFQDQVIELDSIADAHCDKVYNEIFKQAQDSLYNLRVEEIRTIIEQ